MTLQRRDSIVLSDLLQTIRAFWGTRAISIRRTYNGHSQTDRAVMLVDRKGEVTPFNLSANRLSFTTTDGVYIINAHPQPRYAWEYESLTIEHTSDDGDMLEWELFYVEPENEA